MNINPYISAERGVISFQAKDANAFLHSAQVLQSTAYDRYGVFNYMKLNKLRKHVLNWFESHPWLFKEPNFCEFVPSGKGWFKKTELEPCMAEVKLKQCKHPLLNSCFEHLYNVNADGSISEDKELGQIMAQVLSTYVHNIHTGRKLIPMIGQMISDSQIDDIAADADQAIVGDFKQSLKVCEGIYSKLAGWAAGGASYLNEQSIFADAQIGDDGLLTEESVLSIWKKTNKVGRGLGANMRGVLNKGGVRVLQNGRQKYLRAVWVVSPFLWESIANIYRTSCDTMLKPQCRITAENIGTVTEPETAYFIDGVLVYSDSSLEQLEGYIKNRVLSGYLTFAGNIQLGGSLIDNVQDARAGMSQGLRFVDESLNSNLTPFISLQAYYLFSSEVTNRDMIVGGWQLIEDPFL